jgi:hypothetical protein
VLDDARPAAWRTSTGGRPPGTQSDALAGGQLAKLADGYSGRCVDCGKVWEEFDLCSPTSRGASSSIGKYPPAR